MGKVVLLIDNSNIFISGKERYGDAGARFSYPAFEKMCAEEDEIVEKHIAGSTPPSDDAFGGRMRTMGYEVHTYERVSAGYGRTKEKGVDTVLVMQGAGAIDRIKPDRVVLLTGDRDFMPIADLKYELEYKGQHTFVLDIWVFSNAMSPELQMASGRAFLIDEHQEDLVSFQNEDGTTGTFLQHTEDLDAEKAEAKRKAAERAAAREEEKRQAALERAAREAERERAAAERAAREAEKRQAALERAAEEEREQAAAREEEEQEKAAQEDKKRKKRLTRVAKVIGAVGGAGLAIAAVVVKRRGNAGAVNTPPPAKTFWQELKEMADKLNQM